LAHLNAADQYATPPPPTVKGKNAAEVYSGRLGYHWNII